MDRELPKDVIRRRWYKRIAALTALFALVIGCVWGVNRLLTSSIRAKELKTFRVERGSLETSISSSGQVVAAQEEIILSPISSRILEVYHQSGDEVEEGTPLLRLNLDEAQEALDKLHDEAQMKRLQLEQLRVQQSTALADLVMKIQVDSMKVVRLEGELEGERYLDSLGSGTAEKVRLAELALQSARMELAQSRRHLQGQRVQQQADIRIKQLEMKIFEKNLQATERTLHDAEIRSPRHATVTRILTQVGAQVSQGAEVATIADLTSFVVQSQLAENMASWCSTGTRVKVKVGDTWLTGHVGQVDAASQGGMITFKVQLDEADNPNLRPGLRAEVHLLSDIRQDVLRVARGAFNYQGPGDYPLFVRTSEDLLERRTVRLGESNYEFIEVVSGLQEGDEVVLSDMSAFSGEREVKISK
ncbi:MAG: HlyD family efflux transporter periplasmic adaptor subunit [Bacteroidaceae bacterium]|nr:HlyD family efflux transporter periplasmic adaptor subunit [Bacteroidaceae bacterium]